MSKPVLRTQMCDLLGIEYPIMCTGMGGVSSPELIAAVGNAGGLGSLGVGRGSPDQLRDAIRETKKLLDPGRPLAMSLPAARWAYDKEYAKEFAAKKKSFPDAHVKYVQQLKKEFGLPPAQELPSMEDETGSNVALMFGKGHDLLDVCIEEKIPVIISFFGDPVEIVPKARAAGIKVVSMIGQPRHAVKCRKTGSDAVVATGWEAGGHITKIASMPLIPQVVDVVPGMPVIGAGGVMDGRGLAAMLALGAVGVNCGTVFCACAESGAPTAQIPFHHKERMADWWREYAIKRWLESGPLDAVHTIAYAGGDERLRRTDYTEAWLRKEAPDPLPVGEHGTMIREFLRSVYEAKRGDLIPIGMGQGVGMLTKVRTVKEVVDEMVEGARNILNKRLPETVQLS